MYIWMHEYQSNNQSIHQSINPHGASFGHVDDEDGDDDDAGHHPLVMMMVVKMMMKMIVSDVL